MAKLNAKRLIECLSEAQEIIEQFREAARIERESAGVDATGNGAAQYIEPTDRPARDNPPSFAGQPRAPAQDSAHVKPAKMTDAEMRKIIPSWNWQQERAERQAKAAREFDIFKK